MSILKPLALLCVVSISFLVSASRAQQKSQWPPGLSQDSSLREILDRLDKEYFGRAWIGLDGARESAVFSRGFRLTKTDGCHLTLRNDDIKVLSFASGALPNEYESLEFFRKQAPAATSYPAELYIRLNRLNPKQGKGPRLHTKDPVKAKLLGSWQTEFAQQGGRYRPQDVLLLIIFDSVPGDGRDEMYGGKITFTFDDKETSERFDAAFRQAIKLCTMK